MKHLQPILQELVHNISSIRAGKTFAPDDYIKPALASIKKDLLEVIGEDTHRKDCPANGFTCVCPLWQQNENDTKQDVRKRLERYIG